jgi:hypothetical protein
MAGDMPPIKKRLLGQDYFDSRRVDGGLLFHYTDREAALEHILYEGLLKFTALKWSHDPLESDDYEYSAASNATGIKAVAMDSLKQQIARGHQEGDIVKRRAKIACFTVDPGDLSLEPHLKGCFRSRMWTQFAEAHSGMCLAFDKGLLLSSIAAQLNRDDQLLSKKVTYQNYDSQRFEVAFKRPWEDSPVPEQAVLDRAGVHFFGKVEDHRDESEFRIVFWRAATDLSGNPEFLEIRDALVGIILGKRFPQAYVGLAKDQANRLGVPSFQLSWYLGTPRCEKL